MRNCSHNVEIIIKWQIEILELENIILEIKKSFTSSSINTVKLGKNLESEHSLIQIIQLKDKLK